MTWGRCTSACSDAQSVMRASNGEHVTSPSCTSARPYASLALATMANGLSNATVPAFRSFKLKSEKTNGPGGGPAALATRSTQDTADNARARGACMVGLVVVGWGVVE
jgi:hypothetical protein